MKGITGIVVAICLGIAGVLANLFYLHNEAQKVETLSFIGIKKGVIIGRGERLVEDNLVKVDIPKNHVGNLVDYAFLWKELVGVKNEPVWRALDSSDDSILLMQSDLKTPPKELELAKGEEAVCVPVPRNFVTSHINPGDKVSFKFWNGPTAPAPTPAPKEPAAAPVNPKEATAASVADGASLIPKADQPDPIPIPAAVEPEKAIGPFVVKSIGNRLSSLEVMKTAKISPLQQDVLVIRVSKNVPGEEQMYEKLGARLHSAGPNSYDVILVGKD